MQRISDPYHVLGVGRDATSAEVKAAHRRLAKRLHPDGPQADPNAFLSVQDAYELLSDPLRRTEWDRTHAPGPVRAGESPRSGGRATRARATERPSRPAAGPASRPPVHRDTDHAARAGATTPGAASADSAGPRPRPHTARPLDAAAGPDPDPFSRSSGAAWSSASRAFFRRASADMPSGAAHPNTPRWTTPLGGTPPPRYEVPRQRPPAGPSDGPPAAQHAAVVPRPVRRHAWPSLAQRAEAGLLAALPPVVMAAFAAFDRFGARGAQVAALVTLVVLWGVFGALPRAAWIAARGALGAAVGLGAALLLGLALPPDKPIFTAFLFGSFIVGAGYLAGVALAMRDVPVRRPWLPAASETE